MQPARFEESSASVPALQAHHPLRPHRNGWDRTSLSLLAIPLALFAAGCKQGPPPSKPLADLTATEQSGRAVFQTHCAACHYPSSVEPLHGPGLQGLFKRPYLNSGAPANDDRVAATILHGRNNMPPIPMDNRQMQDLLAYLHTL